jgi:hypothetical protein
LIQIAYKVYLQVGTHVWGKKTAPSAQKIYHFQETKKTHHWSHCDRSTGSLATAMANFFHQLIQIAYTCLMRENSTIRAKNMPFPGDKENSPRKPPWQVNQEPRTSNGQFLSSIKTDYL